MNNQVKDKIASMVLEAIKGRMEGVILSWPEHSIRFLGHVPAGKAKIEIRSTTEYETTILIKTPTGPRHFSVKVVETY